MIKKLIFSFEYIVNITDPIDTGEILEKMQETGEAKIIDVRIGEFFDE